MSPLLLTSRPCFLPLLRRALSVPCGARARPFFRRGVRGVLVLLYSTAGAGIEGAEARARKRRAFERETRRFSRASRQSKILTNSSFFLSFTPPQNRPSPGPSPVKAAPQRYERERERENKRGRERRDEALQRQKNRRSEFDIVFFSSAHLFSSSSPLLPTSSSQNSLLRPTTEPSRREPSRVEPTAPRSPFRPLRRPRAASGLLLAPTTTTTTATSSSLPLPLRSSTFTASTCSAPRTRSPRPPRPPGPRPSPPRR